MITVVVLVISIDNGEWKTTWKFHYLITRVNCNRRETLTRALARTRTRSAHTQKGASFRVIST